MRHLNNEMLSFVLHAGITVASIAETNTYNQL